MDKDEQRETLIALRHYVENDRSAFMALVRDKRVMKYVNGPIEKHQAERLFQEFLAPQTEKKAWAVVDSRTGDYTGHTALKNTEMPGTYEIIVLLKPEYQKHGLGTLVLSKVLCTVIETRQCQRIIATIDADNVGARRLVERCGMRLLRWETDEQGDYPVYSIDLE